MKTDRLFSLIGWYEIGCSACLLIAVPFQSGILLYFAGILCIIFLITGVGIRNRKKWAIISNKIFSYILIIPVIYWTFLGIISWGILGNSSTLGKPLISLVPSIAGLVFILLVFKLVGEEKKNNRK